MRGEANGGGEDRRPRGEDQEHDGGDDDEEEERPQRQAQAQRPATRPSSGPQPPPPLQNQQHPPPPPPGVLRNVGYVGKHRLSAAITRLDQELQSLQEELNELETMEPASTACQDVITSTEGKPDPLLPITSGPENSSWDRWFQRVRSSRSNKWWASRGSDFS